MDIERYRESHSERRDTEARRNSSRVKIQRESERARANKTDENVCARIFSCLLPFDCNKTGLQCQHCSLSFLPLSLCSPLSLSLALDLSFFFLSACTLTLSTSYLLPSSLLTISLFRPSSRVSFFFRISAHTVFFS